MKKCKSCQKEIDKKASKCPYCQTDQRNWFKKHPILSVIIGIIVLGIIGSSAGGNKNTGSNSQTNTQQTNNTTPEVKPTPIIVDATALVGEYDKNKLSAQEKYTGKVVQTTAYIKNISGGDFGGDYYLSLDPTNDQYYLGTSIQCYFKDKNALTPLVKGQSVTVMGTMQDMSIGIVEIKDCSLVK